MSVKKTIAKELLWRDILETSGNYFSGTKEKKSKWYRGFSQLPLELDLGYRRSE